MFRNIIYSNGADRREYFERTKKLLNVIDRKSIVSIVLFYRTQINPQNNIFDKLTPRQRIFYRIG